MSDEREQEFLALLEWASNLPRPKLNYAVMAEADFLSVHFYHRLITYQACYMVLLRTIATGLLSGLAPEPIVRKGGLSFKEIIDWSRNLSSKTLFQAYSIYPHPGLVGLLADLKMEEPFLGAEMARRIKNNPLSCEFILLDWGGTEDRVKEVERLLKVDKISAYRSWEEDQEDIQHTAWEKAFEIWRQSSDKSEKPFPLPSFPVPLEEMLPDERAFWEGLMARAWKDGRQAFLRETVPILTGEKEEQIVQKVRENRRERFRTSKRRREVLKESGRREEIRRMIHSTSKPISPDIALARREAQARWGEKGRLFLDALITGKTVTEAAKTAGVSRKTGHKYLKILNKSHL